MLSSLRGLLVEQVRDLYSAEHQLIKALPQFAKASSDVTLKGLFLNHLEETRTHADRLEVIAERLGIQPTGKVCKAMQGLIAEGDEVLREAGEEPVVDAALIAAAQRVEHYEISAYGTLRAIAERLGQHDVVRLVQETLNEEHAADEKLTGVSEGGVLKAALAAGAH